MNNKIEEVEEVEEIKKEEFIKYLKSIRNDENNKSVLMSVLHKTQDLYGYISKDAIEEISYYLDIPSAHIWGAATFYHYFSLKPRGKYIISVCMGTACYVKGAKRILDKIKEELGIEMNETTEDKMFTLEEKACLGCCGLAPVMMINGKVYGELTAEKTGKILEGLKKDTMVKL